MLLDGKVVIVSGIGPGLGKEIALACAREGASVVVSARTESNVEELAEALRGNGAAALGVPGDITDLASCDRIIATATDEFGGVDVLVNNAFRGPVFQPAGDANLDKWRRTFEVNVFGTMQMCQAAVPAMKARGAGSIVFVNSMAARKPIDNQGGYASSKSALLAAARQLAYELGPEHIRVNTVVPGWMWGPPVKIYCRMEADRRGITPEEVRDEIAAGIPLREIPPDDDVANAVVFFASDLSRVVTGQALDVNGGEHMP